MSLRFTTNCVLLNLLLCPPLPVDAFTTVRMTPQGCLEQDVDSIVTLISTEMDASH